eukprot:6214057-Pleurochrysis_carterae.AAC.2
MKGCNMSDVWDMSPSNNEAAIGNGHAAPPPKDVKRDNAVDLAKSQEEQTHVIAKQFDILAVHLSRQMNDLRNEQQRLYTKLWLTSVVGTRCSFQATMPKHSDRERGGDSHNPAQHVDS